MGIIKCSECGKEISDKAANCPNCGCPVGFISAGAGISNTYNSMDNSPYQNNNPYQTQQSSLQVRPYTPKQKNSGLGIAALVLSILGCTFWLGIILAIVDLCKKDNNKKTCSIIALCVCGFWIIAGIVVNSGGKSSEESVSGRTAIESDRTSETLGKNIDVETSEEGSVAIEELQAEDKSEDRPEENGEKLSTGTYIVGEDIESGKYNFYAYKGTGSLKAYKSYDDYKNDEYGFDAFMEFDILANGASVGLLNEDVYTDTVSNIRLSDGWCLVIDKGLEMKYQVSESSDVEILSVGTYIIGEDIPVGKYNFTAIVGSGSVKIYNSYDEYLEDEYGFDAFEDYDMKEENASVGLLNEDVYTESVNNIRLDDGQCLVIEKGLKLQYEIKK